MESKIQKEFIDTGFGFPVRLINVQMVKVRGAWTPKLNYNELALAVLRLLTEKESRLTGNEIKFIRTHFEMTLQEFSKRFCVTHVAVLKWERTKNSGTAMNWTTEKDIRLFILTKLGTKSNDLAKLYHRLETLADRKVTPIHLNATDIAA